MGGSLKSKPIMPHHLRLGTMLRGLCPECGEGRIFASRWRMNPTCPVCGTKFERGPGYFTGRDVLQLRHGHPDHRARHADRLADREMALHWAVLVVWVAFLPLVPFVFRLSRVLFIHFDRYFDPDEAPRPEDHSSIP